MLAMHRVNTVISSQNTFNQKKNVQAQNLSCRAPLGFIRNHIWKGTWVPHIMRTDPVMAWLMLLKRGPFASTGRMISLLPEDYLSEKQKALCKLPREGSHEKSYLAVMSMSHNIDQHP